MGSFPKKIPARLSPDGLVRVSLGLCALSDWSVGEDGPSPTPATAGILFDCRTFADVVISPQVAAAVEISP